MPTFMVNRHVIRSLILLLSILDPELATRAQTLPSQPPHIPSDGSGEHTTSLSATSNVTAQVATIGTRSSGAAGTGGVVNLRHLTQMPLEAVTVAGHRLLAAGAHGLIILSDDDGNTWRQVPTPTSNGLTGIQFDGDHIGWAIGHAGVVLRTGDGGEHWTIVQDGADAAQAVLRAAESGSEADSVRAGRIKSAQALVANPSRPFVLMQLAGADTIRLIGTGELSSETTDGGKTWRPWWQAIDDPTGEPLYGLAQRDGVLVLVGARGRVLVGRPEDGLHPIKSPGEATLFGALSFNNTLLVYGQQGHVYESVVPLTNLSLNKAPDWHAISNPSQTTVTASLARWDDSILLADASGMIWRLSGKNIDAKLIQMGGNAPFAILGMAEASDKSVIAVGPGGLIHISPAVLNGAADGS